MRTPLQITPKKFFWTIVKVGIVIAFLAALASCKKDQEIPTSVRKINLSVSYSNSQDGLKSASTVIKQSIANGDTTTRPDNINLIMNATDENGYPVSGRWQMPLVKTDYDFMTYFVSTHPESSDFGDQIAHNFLEKGLYKISFTPIDPGSPYVENPYCYLQIGSTPGKLGDGGANNFIFRLEKKILLDTRTYKLKSFLFAYYKYAKKDIKPSEAYCMLTDIQKNGFYPNEMWHLQKWSFNRDYYYLVIDPDKEGSLGSYQLFFLISDTDGEKGYADGNNYLSSWANQWGQIEFAAY